MTIYCEAASKPSVWSSDWNSGNCSVVWNCNYNEADNDGNIYYIADSGIRYALNNGTATVIGQSTALSGEIIIPEEITYKDVAYSVTTINAYAFSGCSGLTSVNFNGTMAQWGAISKGIDWSWNTGNFTIICTDGTLDRNGNQIS